MQKVEFEKYLTLPIDMIQWGCAIGNQKVKNLGMNKITDEMKAEMSHSGGGARSVKPSRRAVRDAKTGQRILSWYR